MKNVSPSKLAEIEKLAYEHGDAMLPTRLRGSRRGELGSTEKGVLGSCTTAPGTETTPWCEPA